MAINNGGGFGGVSIAGLGTITGFKTGVVAGSTVATILPTLVCSMVNIKAYAGNVGNVYIGPDTSVTVAGTANNFTGGFELDGGQETGWLPVKNLNEFARICDNDGDDICYIAIP